MSGPADFKLPAKIISGGQTGADRAALDFAQAAGIRRGGFCPAGRRSADGEIPAEYPMVETASSGYPERTEMNVMFSDATVIFNPGPTLSQGSALTLNFCKQHRKPFLILRNFPPGEQIDDSGTLAAWLEAFRPETLNVAGNREAKVPGISALVVRTLTRAWQLCESTEQVEAMASARAAAAPARQGHLAL